jgi:hypothetical protein
MHGVHAFLLACAPRNMLIEATFISLDALMFDYHAFDAAGPVGTGPGGTSGEQTFVACISIVPHLCRMS